jgi:hypothetical protein
LGFIGILLGYGLAHLAHYVLDPGPPALITQPPFFALSCPLHRG